MPIDIKYPKKGRIFTHRLWCVSGFGDLDATGFTGRVVDSKGVELAGTTVIHLPKQFSKGGVRRRRWLILFNDSTSKLSSGSATLYVKGSAGPEGAREFELEFPSLELEAVSITPSITDDEDITDEAEAFAAWGSMTDYSITSVTMNNISADFINEDWDSLTWTAQFPPLSTGVYTLRAIDANNSSDSRSGLTVD